MEWIVMISVFIIDLVSKSLVENFLDFNVVVPMIPYVFNAHKTHNYNAAFGASWLRNLLTDMGARIFFCVFAVAASVAFILVLIRHKGKSKVFRIAIALFVAGAMGNCIDRMALGYVRDYIEFVYLGMTIGGSKTWPYIFNIADVALVSGVCLIVFYFLFLYRDGDKKKLGEAGDVSGVTAVPLENGETVLDSQEGAETAEAAEGELTEADGGPQVEADGEQIDPQQEQSLDPSPQDDTKEIGGDAL